MRRRRPSALYTVLDEEQLLGGVDLTDHPDPLAGRPAADVRDEWDEWSPDAEDHPYEDAAHPWEAHDVDIDVDIDSPPATGEAEVVGGNRRRWLTVGFVGALVCVLLVARELGAALDAAGPHSAGRPASGGLAADLRPPAARSAGSEAAPQSVSRSARPPARGSSGGSRPRIRPAPAGVDSPVRGGATRRALPRPPGAAVSAAGRAMAAPGPGPGPAKPGGGISAAPSAPQRTVVRTRGSGVPAAPAAWPSRSPDREFGFER